MRRFRGMGGKWAFLYKYGIYRSIPAKFCMPAPVSCPELGREVSFETCLRCDKRQIWHPRDEIARCWHEYKDLKSRGYYDGTWDDHPENFDPETFREIQEQKRLYEEINREMDAERTELESKAEELMKDSELGRESTETEDRQENTDAVITTADIEEEDLQEDKQTMEEENGEQGMEEDDYEYHEVEYDEEEEY